MCIFADPLNRVAPNEPPTHRNDGRGYTITQQRLQQIRSQFMYWFFDQGGPENQGDLQRDIHASNQQVHKNFNFQLPFFGFRFNYTRVSRLKLHWIELDSTNFHSLGIVERFSWVFWSTRALHVPLSVSNQGLAQAEWSILHRNFLFSLQNRKNLSNWFWPACSRCLFQVGCKRNITQ